jgi:hypothetical protein
MHGHQKKNARRARLRFLSVLLLTETSFPGRTKFRSDYWSNGSFKTESIMPSSHCIKLRLFLTAVGRLLRRRRRADRTGARLLKFVRALRPSDVGDSAQPVRSRSSGQRKLCSAVPC